MLRALADQLGAEALTARQISRNTGNEDGTRLMFLQNAALLSGLEAALDRAADRLEQEQRDLKPPNEGVDKPVVYNPRAKRGD